MGNPLARILFGKLRTETFQVIDAKATLTNEEGKIFTLTSDGEVYQWADGEHYLRDGRTKLERYLSKERLQVFVTDDGLVPACRVKSIEIVDLPPRNVTLTFRTGGLLG